MLEVAAKGKIIYEHYSVQGLEGEVSQSQVQDCVFDSEVGRAEKTVMGSSYALTQIKKLSA